MLPRLSAAALLLALAASPALALDDLFPKAGAAYLVLRNGEPLWGAATLERRAPASLAKIMTALVVLEAGLPPAEAAVVGAGAAGATGKRLGLRAGERLSVGDLLAASVIASANDACRALVEHAGGTRERFAARMNRRAAALGMADTRFVDPCGHDRPGQYTTASDMARLAAAAAARPEYLRLAGTPAATIRTLDGARRFKLVNTNALVGRYPGVIGLKSGYTRQAGRCLVALAERGEVRVLLVILDGSDRWWDAAAMVERAFSR